MIRARVIMALAEAEAMPASTAMTLLTTSTSTKVKPPAGRHRDCAERIIEPSLRLTIG